MIKITASVILKHGREASVKRFHPWVFSGALQTIEGEPHEGDWVEVKDFKKKTLGFGHYQKGTITVRLLSFSAEMPNEKIYSEKITRAFRQRLLTHVINEQTNCFRLVHGEGDGLPGLIIDVYNGIAVMQAHSLGMHRDKEWIVNALCQNLPESVQAVYYKSQNTLNAKTENEYLLGMAATPHLITEHGNKFYVDWEEGQKTGFFLDQRENRKLLGQLSSGKSVLNTFCYTGGFSVYALSAGAHLVHSVDSSEKAVSLTKKNIELNGFDSNQHACFAMDTFEFLKDKKDAYDVIVLDPPAFAKHKDARHQAMKGYQRLNAEAMKIIKPNGIIFTFSCSQVVDKQLFYDTVVSSAIQAGREIKVLQHLGQPADHPVSIYHPEGEYLKGLVLYVS
ncbi:MAG: 23S rRNA (cytosine(1962)-C(5))-methyltransferase [Cytophagales bacterium]|jgi:23S rRNA (cytosine1962-C5)-methyltransferase|nr:class I SAM-dependent rRNA methyltransferase [Bacteroidota bacterium]MBS1981863.1 class I SAM-dependent rRNA methyltransferase [Bacteroidota bacterium]WHZ07484.1 MAG: 23S rRNA (cytosine(1962)-C(5))-methyltransferase [Cytophagales bacterium]